MSQENVEAFKRGLEAGNRGDVEGLLEELDPEVEWHSALHALLGGNRRCFGATTASARCSETSTRPSTKIHIEMSEIRDLGDRLVAIGRTRTRGKASGVETETPLASRDRGQERQDDLDSGLPRSQGGPRSRGAVGVAGHSRSEPPDQVFVEPEGFFEAEAVVLAAQFAHLPLLLPLDRVDRTGAVARVHEA